MVEGASLSKAEYTAFYNKIGKFLAEWIPVVTKEKPQAETNPFLLEAERGFLVVLHKHQTKCFNVALVALCKSGKSTFLNAMMGRDFLPSHNVPETACIVRVKHTPDRKDGRLVIPGKPETCIYGREITVTLRQVNNQARETNSAPPEMVLEAPLVALSDKSFEGCQTSFDVSDTPGPNEAGTDAVRPQVEALMNSADVILYILDYSKLKTEEEAQILQKLKSMRPDLIRDITNRLFIVVNKMDLVKKRHGLDFQTTKEYVAGIFRDMMPELSIKPDRVLPVSAERALLSRQILNYTASQNVREDCCELMFGQDWDVQDIDDEKMSNGAERLLAKSGFIEMENEVLTFLFEHQATIFISSMIGDALRHMYIFNNYLHTTKAAMLKRSNENWIRQLKRDLESIKTEFESTLKSFADTTALMQKWVEDQFARFAFDMQNYVDALLAGEADVMKVHTSVEEHKTSLQAVNARVADHLMQRFFEFRKELECAAFQRQQDIFDKLAKKLQPFLEQVGTVVGKLLSIEGELIAAEMQFPAVTVESFRLNIDRSISALLIAKTSLFHLIKGWCTSGGLVLDSDTQYHTNIAQLKQMWADKIKDNTNYSIHTAKYLVGEKVKETLRHAQQYLEHYIAGYTQSVENAINEASKTEERRRQRLAQLTELIEMEKAAITMLREMEASSKAGFKETPGQ
jgi:GTPase SAR1 family protein